MRRGADQPGRLAGVVAQWVAGLTAGYGREADKGLPMATASVLPLCYRLGYGGTEEALDLDASRS